MYEMYVEKWQINCELMGFWHADGLFSALEVTFFSSARFVFQCCSTLCFAIV